VALVGLRLHGRTPHEVILMLMKAMETGLRRRGARLIPPVGGTPPLLGSPGHQDLRSRAHMVTAAGKPSHVIFDRGGGLHRRPPLGCRWYNPPSPDVCHALSASP